MKSEPLIMVAMSGGVDSSVTACLLQRQGRSIEGLFMKNWEEDDRQSGACTSEEDAADASRVAQSLGIPLHHRNFAAEYWDYVFEEFLEEYRAGRTPNPDILCNREIKFKTFIEHAEDLGAETIATGHYVRRGEQDGRFQLLKGKDPGKDQSYFLYAISQEALAKSLFPVGELQKDEVRQIALDSNFEVHNKKDSTGICFIGERDFKPFLKQYLGEAKGLIKTSDNVVLGEHEGLMFYTLGQRQGLGIGGVPNYPEEPWYVLHKDQETGDLFVGQGHDHPWLQSQNLIASQLTWISGTSPEEGSRLTAKVRYRQHDQECQVTGLSDDRIELRFKDNQRAVTPGQSVVLYDGDECLGGGIIDLTNTIPARMNG